MVDGSRDIQADQYAGVQQLLGSMVEQLAVSEQPRGAGRQARVAVLQQSGGGAWSEFGLQAYAGGAQMRAHLRDMRQAGGAAALGRTLDFALNEVLLKAAHPRRRKLLFAVVGGAFGDAAELRQASHRAHCEGVALFVVAVGNRYNRRQVEEIASTPLLQHVIHVGGMNAGERAYIRRFFRVFINALNSKPRPPATSSPSIVLTVSVCSRGSQLISPPGPEGLLQPDGSRWPTVLPGWVT